MLITLETKKRFVKMLKSKQIIVIECNKGNYRKTYAYKFIGANSGGRWDFTPLVAQYSHYRNNGSSDVKRLTIFATDGIAVLCDTLDSLEINAGLGNGYSQYSQVSELVSTFYV